MPQESQRLLHVRAGWPGTGAGLLPAVRDGFRLLLLLCLVVTGVLVMTGARPAVGVAGVAAMALSSWALWRHRLAGSLGDVAAVLGVGAIAAASSADVGMAVAFTGLQLRALYGSVRSTTVTAVAYLGAFVVGRAVAGGEGALALGAIKAPAAIGMAVALSLLSRAIRWQEGSQARLAALVEASSDVLLVVGGSGRAPGEDVITYASPAVLRLIPGYLPAQQPALTDAVHPADVESLQAAFTALRHGELDSLTVECRMGSEPVGWRDVELTARDHRHNQHVGGLVCTVHDVTERNQLHSARLEEAMRDSLTGLPNRAGLVALLERKSLELTGAVLIRCDLEGTKRLNDYLGHEVGDSLLVCISTELTRLAGEGAVVARIGDDEFALVLPPPCEDAHAAASRVVEGFGGVALANAQVAVRARAGFARISRLTDGLQVLRDATIALSEARRTDMPILGFEDHMRSDVLARMDLEADLRAAVGTAQIELVYQPVVSLDTGLLMGVEALVRWRRPGYGLVFPADFIPVAEATGIIVDLGAWVMHEACRQAGEWLRQGTAVRIAVNVAAGQFEDDAFTEVVAAALLDAELPPRYLVIEVTESTVVRSTLAVAEILASLRSIGIGISLDDFGTGYSSLAYLHHLPVDTVKIDQSFVRELGKAGGGSEVLVRSIVTLARSLQLTTVAEGIETDEQRATMADMGADRGQGYLFDKPLTAGDLELTWLREAAAPPETHQLLRRPGVLFTSPARS